MARAGTNHKGGRPVGSVAKSTLYAIKFKEKIAELAYTRANEMIQAQIDAAIGVTAEKYDRKTGDLYYVEEGPNPTAFKGIIEHVIGRPKETVALEVGGGLVKLNITLVDSIKKIYGQIEQTKQE